MTEKTASASASIEHILTADELRILREAFAKTQYQFGDGSLAKFDGLYPAGRPVFDPPVKHFLDHTGPDGQVVKARSKLSMLEYERIVLAVLSSTHAPIAFRAIHLYSIIALGVDPSEVAESLLVVQWYSGVEAYTIGLPLLESTLRLLKILIAQGKTSCREVVGAVSAAAPPLTLALPKT